MNDLDGGLLFLIPFARLSFQPFNHSLDAVSRSLPVTIELDKQEEQGKTYTVVRGQVEQRLDLGRTNAKHKREERISTTVDEGILVAKDIT